MAYNTKLYKSTGSGWNEVRVASEWGLIANKPSTFTPTAHSHPEYVKTSGNQTITGTLRTFATTDASSDTTVTTKAYVLGKCLGKTETAANSAKLGGQLPSYYASKSDVPVITYSNGTLTITTG